MINLCMLDQDNGSHQLFATTFDYKSLSVLSLLIQSSENLQQTIDILYWDSPPPENFGCKTNLQIVHLARKLY